MSVSPSVFVSVRMEISAPMGRIFMGGVKLHIILRSHTVTDIVNEVSSCILNCAVIHPLLTFLTNSVKLHSVLRSHNPLLICLMNSVKLKIVLGSNIRY